LSWDRECTVRENDKDLNDQVNYNLNVFAPGHDEKYVEYRGGVPLLYLSQLSHPRLKKPREDRDKAKLFWPRGDECLAGRASAEQDLNWGPSRTLSDELAVGLRVDGKPEDANDVFGQGV
jgi:hypothetical protein